MKIKQIFQKTVSIGIMIAMLLSVAAGSLTVSSYGETGEIISHFKTGVQTSYKLLTNGTVQLGDGSKAAIAADTSGNVFIPKDVTSVDAWETVRSFRVSKIGPKAFDGCEAIKTIHFEGQLSIAAHALDGLSSKTVFETGSTETKKALLKYGIAADRVKYKPARTKYVAFGDSIAAGYALPSYVQEEDMTGDKYPTPSDAFVALTGNALNKSDGPAITDNQAVSGWTSQQLLDQLNRGDYDPALEDADVVTVTIGSNDLLGPFMKIVGDAIDKEFGTEKSKSANVTGVLKRPIPIVNNFVERISNVINTLNEDLENNETLNQACLNFQQNLQPAILKKLKEAAPDAEIYWTTLYNPFYGEVLDIKTLMPELEKKVTPETWKALNSIDLGKYGAKYIEEMNRAFAVNKTGYHQVDLYESFNQDDLTNVEISRNDDGALNLNFDPHPNHTGHQLIADIAVPIIQKTYISKAPAADISDKENAETVKDATTPEHVAATDSGKGSVVATGDDSSMKVPLILLCVSLLLMTILLILSRRKSVMKAGEKDE